MKRGISAIVVGEGSRYPVRGAFLNKQIGKFPKQNKSVCPVAVDRDQRPSIDDIWCRVDVPKVEGNQFAESVRFDAHEFGNNELFRDFRC